METHAVGRRIPRAGPIDNGSACRNRSERTYRPGVSAIHARSREPDAVAVRIQIEPGDGAGYPPGSNEPYPTWSCFLPFTGRMKRRWRHRLGAWFFAGNTMLITLCWPVVCFHIHSRSGQMRWLCCRGQRFGHGERPARSGASPDAGILSGPVLRYIPS